MPQYLRKLTTQLVAFLEKNLPPLFAEHYAWWQSHVLPALSTSQRREASKNRARQLGDLDLASLLAVLTFNWQSLASSPELELDNEARNHANEVKSIRNRWAHTTSEEPPAEDIYRDLDTLQRFAATIGADETVIKELRETKAALLTPAATALPLTPAVAPATPEVPIAPAVPSMTETTLYVAPAPATPKVPIAPAPPVAIAPLSPTPSIALTPASSASAPALAFAPGTLVRLNSNPDIQAAVISVTPSAPEPLITVFLDNRLQSFYASQFLPISSASDSSPDSTTTTSSATPLSAELFHAHLSAIHLRYPGNANLYSLNAARIDFIPYQFRPVLRFIRADRPRLLIADGVGVGKTIEAGLILRELQARREIQSVLIICPRPLVAERKWQNEMKRFDEDFIHLDGPTLRHCINETDLNGEWPERQKKIIVPYSLFDETILHGAPGDKKHRRKKGLLNLDPPPRFDLVIVDEAHHIRNPDTYAHNAVRFFCDHAEAVVFLTATPIQLGNSDLYVLLNALRPDLIIDEKSFTHMAAPNPYINQAAAAIRARAADWQTTTLAHLDQAATTDWGRAILSKNPAFIQLYKQLQNYTTPASITAAATPTSPTPADCVKMLTTTENLHTFSGIINRTLRRDIGAFTIRKPETIAVPFTPSQRLLHDQLIHIQTRLLSGAHGDHNLAFMLTTLRRQAASSLHGLIPFLEDILARRLGTFQTEDNEDDDPAPASSPTLAPHKR